MIQYEYEPEAQTETKSKIPDEMNPLAIACAIFPDAINPTFVLSSTVIFAISTSWSNFCKTRIQSMFFFYTRACSFHLSL